MFSLKDALRMADTGDDAPAHRQGAGDLEPAARRAAGLSCDRGADGLGMARPAPLADRRARRAARRDRLAGRTAARAQERISYRLGPARQIRRASFREKVGEYV